MASIGQAGVKRPKDKDEGAPRRPRAMIVDDADGMRSYLATLLENRGFDVDTCKDGRNALALLESGADPDVVLLDVMMSGIDGMAALARICESWPELPVLMVSAVGKAATIVETMRLGAADYLTKPFEESDLDDALDRLGLHSGAAARNAEPRSDVTAGPETAWISPAMREIRSVVEQIGETDVTVLIQGESGVGKEVVAREVHRLSNRSDGPFVKVNCAALPTELLESELFGYEKGAFTGANGRKHGKFELADGGTMFLDEIGEMCPSLQAKLLQVLQDSEFTRLGGNQEVKVNVRVVCATNRSLLDMVETGEFREDLYFRLNVVAIDLPPLRDRREEVPILIETFLSRYCALYGRPQRKLSNRLMEGFETYRFPGNVRELENMIKRVIVLENEDSIMADLAKPKTSRAERREELDALLVEMEETAGEEPLRDVSRRFAQEVEREAIEYMLKQTGWNRKATATRLGISYKTLLQKIRDCSVDAAH